MRALWEFVAATVAAPAALWLATVAPESPTRVAPDAVEPPPQDTMAPTPVAPAAVAPTHAIPRDASPRAEPAAGLRERIEPLLTLATPHERYRAFGLLADCVHAVDFDRYLESLPVGERRSRRVPGAASAWIEEGPFGDRSALTQRPDDPPIVEWAERAIERVHVATRRADTEAINQYALLSLHWDLDDVARVRLLVDEAVQRRREERIRAFLE